MGTSKKQREKIPAVCKCGCGEIFYPFPIYRPKSQGGGLRTPEYKVGHHPSPKKTLFGKVPAWNKGMKKGDHPSIERMGFQPGHEAFSDWKKVNERIRTDKEFKAKWVASKKGQVSWNKGITKEDYKNGIKKGPDHGNWKGGKNGIRDTSEYADFRKSIFVRDNYSCQECGDANHLGRGKTVVLNMHHIVPFSHDLSLVFDPSNVITLCEPCHHKTDSYGFKAVTLKRKRQEAKRQ